MQLPHAPSCVANRVCAAGGLDEGAVEVGAGIGGVDTVELEVGPPGVDVAGIVGEELDEVVGVAGTGGAGDGCGAGARGIFCCGGVCGGGARTGTLERAGGAGGIEMPGLAAGGEICTREGGPVVVFEAIGGASGSETDCEATGAASSFCPVFSGRLRTSTKRTRMLPVNAIA